MNGLQITTTYIKETVEEVEHVVVNCLQIICTNTWYKSNQGILNVVNGLQIVIINTCSIPNILIPFVVNSLQIATRNINAENPTARPSCEWLADCYHLHQATASAGYRMSCEWLTDYMNSSVLRNSEKGGSCEWLTDYMHQHR